MRTAKRLRFGDLDRSRWFHIKSLSEFDARTNVLEGHAKARGQKAEMAHLHEPANALRGIKGLMRSFILCGVCCPWRQETLGNRVISATTELFSSA